MKVRPYSKGDWLHIFPEGKVSKDGELGRLKWGLGKLLCDVEEMGGQQPIVLPFWHSGMEKVGPGQREGQGEGEGEGERERDREREREGEGGRRFRMYKEATGFRPFLRGLSELPTRSVTDDIL